MSLSFPIWKRYKDISLLMWNFEYKVLPYVEVLWSAWNDGLILLTFAKVKVTQSCLTLCDPVDYTVHGILQARILEWAAFSFSRGSSQPRDQTQVSCMAGGFFTS